MTRTRIALVAVPTAVVLVGAIVLAVVLTRSSGDGWAGPEPVAAAAPAGLEKYYTQELTWKDCGGDAHCTTVRVPVDYDDLGAGDTELAVSVDLSRDGQGERSLFVNPGGPGGSAIDYADQMTSILSREVTDLYDVVGVDPRGVGKSSPLDCVNDEEFDAYAAMDPDPETDAEIEANRAATATFGNGCLDRSGSLAEHVSTEETARDMDVVRALLGRSELDWFGASYGTQLGAAYAELFPKNVGRMVLDGAVDPDLTPEESARGQAEGFQRALKAYAEDCVQDDDCPLGTDADAGIAKIRQLLDQLDAEPMQTDDNQRDLSEGQAFSGIAVTLYDKSTWGFLTDALTAAFDGDGTALLYLGDAYVDRRPDGSYGSNLLEANLAINCADVAGRGDVTVAEVEAIVPAFETLSPVFGRALAWGKIGCSDWPIPAAHPYPAITAAGAAPILVVGTTRDPATPYEWAEALAEALDSGVLLTREGDGHTAYASGNRCIVEAVDAFLVGGTVPGDGTTCADE